MNSPNRFGRQQRIILHLHSRTKLKKHVNPPNPLPLRSLLRSDREEKTKVAINHTLMERTTRNATLPARQAKERHSKRYVIRIVSVRTRLLDQDNLSPKYLCDFLRYCGAIPTDAPGTTKIEITQRKVGKEEKEHTEIVVLRIDE